ncbi:hypothetical protein [Lampropedia puyangensis]|uniref:hypothetical protein n=1 Tax=Lampropedia puyangensis TaxID=1330072 RepID=UPI0013054873|nr:hypothetical protein [Lampropedia puyangensis]
MNHTALPKLKHIANVALEAHAKGTTAPSTDLNAATARYRRRLQPLNFRLENTPWLPL